MRAVKDHVKKLSVTLRERGHQLNAHVREMAGGAMLAFSLRVLGMLAGYLFILLVSRMFGATGVGIYTLAVTMVMVLYLPATLGTGPALLRLVPEHRVNGRLPELGGVYGKIILMVLPLCLFCGGATVALAPAIAERIFHDPDMVFAVILSGSTLDEASLAAERLRKAIDELRMNFENSELQITASIGLAESPPEDDCASLIKRADAALYAAKEAGRNCAYRQGKPEPACLIPSA